MKPLLASVHWRKATLPLVALLLLALLVVGWMLRETIFPQWFPKVLRGHADLVNAVAISPDEKIVASGSGDGRHSRGEVRLWDVRTGRLISRRGFGGEVWTLAFSPDGQTLATGTDWGELALWNIKTGQMQQLLTGNPRIGFLWSVAFSPNGKTLVAQKDGELFFWNVATGKLLWKLPWRKSSQTMAAFSPDGKTLVSMAPTQVKTYPDPFPGEPDWTTTTFTFGPAQLLDAKTGHLLKNLPLEPNTDTLGAAFSPDGKTLALISDSYDKDQNRIFYATLTTVDLAANKVKWTQTLHSDIFTAVMFGPDGRTVVTGQGQEEKVVFWDAQTGKPRLTLQNPGNPHFPVMAVPNGLAFSNDGRYLVSRDGKDVKIWRADLLRR